MPLFTIEATYRVPVYRQRTYEADTVEQACPLAIEDDDWSDQKEDFESWGETYITGAWPDADSAYRVPALPVPSQFGEAVQRKANHFETLLGVLKMLAQASEGAPSDLPFWRQRADAAAPKPRRSSLDDAIRTERPRFDVRPFTLRLAATAIRSRSV